MRVHTYAIVVDSGAAPNYDPPGTTLAVCKPRIRRRANVGELVLAFAGARVNADEPHTVVWAGIVRETLTFADYWNDRRFQAKKPACWKSAESCKQQNDCHRTGQCAHPDNFYRPVDGGLLWVVNPVHGPEAAQHDTSGVRVLTFDPSWRFGAHGPRLPESFGLRMTHGRRGERRHDLPDAEWHRLEAWLNDQEPYVAPAPRDRRRCRPSPPRTPKNEPRRQRC
jgi:hypothetical protein